MLIKSFHLLSFVPRYLQTGKTMTESKCIRKYPKCLQSMKKLRVVDYGLTFPLVVTVITILNIPGVVIWGRTSMKVHFCLTAWHKGVTRMTCSFKSKIKLECGPGNFYQVKCNFTPLDMAHIWGGWASKYSSKGSFVNNQQLLHKRGISKYFSTQPLHPVWSESHKPLPVSRQCAVSSMELMRLMLKVLHAERCFGFYKFGISWVFEQIKCSFDIKSKSNQLMLFFSNTKNDVHCASGLYASARY